MRAHLTVVAALGAIACFHAAVELPQSRVLDPLAAFVAAVAFGWASVVFTLLSAASAWTLWRGRA